ncbi:MAG: LysM peptidoglycan-binding domain-containing protein [Betaproteobacteria bacterium]|nr:MAG: LysM peptidoglycan-binding domain-containing protein [Betaproteobacteria bacterium]
MPEQVAQRPPPLLPRPHLPLHAEANDPGPAHLFLNDIPFNAARSDAASAANLWERIRLSFAMQELPSPLVKEWENWYASRPDYLARMLARGERYLFYVVEEVERRGMPSEIALLPMIESAYNPKAYSSAHASGMWQFIPSTGKTYGLRQNWWQDERRDVLAATRAALDYLEKLYEMFGSWELALASYNWGEGAVGRAIQRNEARGLPTDYLSLEMPAETRNYVPKLMAVKNLIARPEDFGVALTPIENRPYFAVVNTDKHIDVKLAAQLAEVPLSEFQALNPSHNRPVIRADVAQPLLVPADRAETFQANLEAHGTKLTSWQSYTIGKGDRLDQIAQRFGIALAQLREVNSIPARLGSLVGMTILVPDNAEGSGGNVAAAGFSTPPVASAIVTSVANHVVKAGETLAGIARRYSTSVAQLATRNGIRNGRILVGQTLSIGETPARSTGSTARRVVAVQRSEPIKVAGNKAKPAAKSQARTTKTPAGRTQVAYASRRN